jgi:anti-anti-sigma factor
MNLEHLQHRENESQPSHSASSAFACDVVYQNDEVRVLVRGNLGLQTVSGLRRAVLAAAALPISRVTIDLGRVESADRYSVRVLVTLQEQVRERSTRFVLASASPPVQRALRAARTWDAFEHESVWSEYPSREFST